VRRVASGMAVGTPSYMSPEQVRNEPLDIRTDLFSFGLVLYEMAAGQRAYLGETRSAIHDAILHQAPPAHDPNPAGPPGLDAVITKALEKDRSRRYQSAAEMREDLARVRAEIQPPRRHLRRWFAAAALLVVVVTALRLYSGLRSHMMLSGTDTIVLADISNETGDPVFDDALNTALRLGLEQTPYLNVLATDKVRGTLPLLKISATNVTPEIARQVCLRTNSKMVIASSVEDAGNGFGIDLNAIDCHSGTAVARVREVATSRNAVVRVLGAAAAQLRGDLGEPAASIARFNKPLDEATSPSLEALQSLVKGYARHLAGDARGARPSYQRATELAPQFALAYLALGAANGNLGEVAPASIALTKTFELRDRLSEPSRFRVEGLYYDSVTGEQEKAYAILSQWVQAFPRDVVAHNNFARCLKLLGQLDRAAAEAREAARLLPSPWSYNMSIIQSTLADRLNEAKALVDEATALKFDSSDLRVTRVMLAFLEGDERSQNEQWHWAVGKPDVGRFLVFQSYVEAYHGHFRSARVLMRQAIDSDRNAGTRPNDRLNEARTEAEVGNVGEAKRLATQALDRTQNRDRQLLLALVLARAGDVELAEQLAASLDGAFPLDTSIQHYCLPTIRAAIKLQANDPAGAVDILRRTEKYELADQDSFSVLYPAYIRGLAYLQMHAGRLAATEFEKLLAHPGLVGTAVTGALSRVQLARAQRMMGDAAAARKSYEDFFTLWKDADSDIPIYHQAKAEYVGLGRTR
jgi:eukaryotic-like serine/threonine-protein kinase